MPEPTCKNCGKNNTPLCKYKIEGDFVIQQCFDWVGIPMLDQMFKKQKALQNTLNTYPAFMDEQYIKDHILAAIVELTEILNETPWKPWKKQQKLNHEKYCKEIADLMHFVINLCIVADIDSDMLFGLYMDKNKENVVRHEEGY